MLKEAKAKLPEIKVSKERKSKIKYISSVNLSYEIWIKQETVLKLGPPICPVSKTEMILSP